MLRTAAPCSQITRLVASPQNIGEPPSSLRKNREDLVGLQRKFIAQVAKGTDVGDAKPVIQAERNLRDISLALVSQSMGFYKDQETNVVYSLQRSKNILLGGGGGFGYSGELRVFHTHRERVQTEITELSMAAKAKFLYLVRGRHDTRCTWVYLLVAPSEKRQFLRELYSDLMKDLFKPMHLENRGCVLFVGYGNTPPCEVGAYLQRRYGKEDTIPEVGGDHVKIVRLLRRFNA